MISKELLSEVLGREVKGEKGRICINENNVTFAYSDESIWSDINVYELANKCKEYILDNGYEIQTKHNVSGVFMDISKDGISRYGTRMKTEFKVVVKIAEWILEQKCQ